jgi:metal transporter CNNM
MSGLTVGYLSIDDLEIELKSINGTDKDKRNAKKVLPILSKRHWLLVSLLLMNSAAMEALPIFLNYLVPEYISVLISVTLVLLFGEIIPQALCTGPNQINIAAFLSPFTLLIMFITSPISYPIGKMLDCCFGEHTKSRYIIILIS